MSNWFVDLEKAAGAMGHDCTVEKVIRIINDGKLTAYARICCQLPNHSTNDDSDDDNDEQYEIARITKIDLTACQPLSPLGTFPIHYEPISNGVEINDHEDEFSDANQATDKYYDPVKQEYLKRVFGCLKSKLHYKDWISTEEICILNSDLQQFLSGDQETKKRPAQILAEKRHNTLECNEYVDRIMEHIETERNRANKDHMVINHIRFIKEANVPDKLFNSVKIRVAKRIKEKYSYPGYLALSRAPKKGVTEPYFLLK